MFFNSIKEISRLKKEINRLLSKGMSNIYLKVAIVTFLKLRFSEFKKFVWEQNCVWLFYCFNFERNGDVLKSKSACGLFSKNISFNKNETEPKMESSTHSFRETKLMFQLI